MEKEVNALLSDAQELVSAHCAQLVRSIGEMGFVGQEQEAFCKLVSAQLLGASLDLWIEIHGDDPAPLEKFVSLRLQVKTARDTGLDKQKSH
jgi:ribosomal protein S18